MFCFSKLVCYLTLVFFLQSVRSDKFFPFSENADLEYTSPDILEDARLDTFSLIKKYGYPCEIHRVYTEDEYILEVHRIPSNSSTAPVVLLQHGLLSSSAEWVLMTPGRGFAYLLADAGYDVWMGNARGNTYSNSHVSLKPSSSAFWNFSWHEIGYYDLPAMIDYILKTTGVPKIHYIGFSQGTTAFWVLMSSRPEYNNKIRAMQALAPVAYMGNAKSPLIKAIAPFTNTLEILFKIMGTNEILPNGKLNELAGQRLCTEEAITQPLCTNLLFLACGFNSEQLNTKEIIMAIGSPHYMGPKHTGELWVYIGSPLPNPSGNTGIMTMLPVVLGHTPAGASTRQLVHFGQLYKSGKFVQFDHGWFGNKRKYGTFKPPAYDLQSIRAPIFLHYSDNDWLATPKDVKKLAAEIPTAIGIYKVPLRKFNHLDFVFAINATELLYNRVINIMGQFKNDP